MKRRTRPLAVLAAVMVGALNVGTAHAAGPSRISDAYTVSFFDDFIFELCGIETVTTLTERWTLTEFADGSTTLHVTRTFVPDDPRIPIEKGAGTTFTAPDGTRTVVGKPIQLFKPGGGVRILDAGWVRFGDATEMAGPHPSLDADPALLYCP